MPRRPTLQAFKRKSGGVKACCSTSWDGPQPLFRGGFRLARGPISFSGARSWTTDFQCYLQLGETRVAGRSEDSAPHTRAQMTPALNGGDQHVPEFTVRTVVVLLFREIEQWGKAPLVLYFAENISILGCSVFFMFSPKQKRQKNVPM